MVGKGKINVEARFSLGQFVLGKGRTVIIRQGVLLFSRNGFESGDRSVLGFQRRDGHKFVGEQHTAFSFRVREDMMLIATHNRITFPVANSALGFNDGRSRVNPLLFGFFPLFFTDSGAVSSTVLAFLTSQILY